jgi:nicotinate-nucleotide--dimethylbenzimidazole phosphoribosyltransferase
MSLLQETCQSIQGLDLEAKAKAQERNNNLAKPVGSLGKVENIFVQLAAITGNPNPKVDNKVIIVMASDNGVCEEGVAAAPQAVTNLMTHFISQGITGVGAFAKQAGADLVTVNIGVMGDINDDRILNRRIKEGTNNITKGPAMTREDAIKALEIGIEVANGEIDKGRNLIGTGEMGIGNTTTSTAILSVYSGLDPKEITGVGANLAKDKFENKVNVIRKSIEVNGPDKNDAIDVLSKVGGFDIAGMAGIMLAGAARQVPVVIDGYISTAAAIIATQIEPKVRDYLICSHSSNEKGAATASALLNFDTMLDLNLRLGEGSGAALMFNIIEAATYMNTEMLTFQEAGIDVV